ncbi:hypothetical protein BH09GEM1_BH09GEM1_22660 [soil metagenome]
MHKRAGNENSSDDVGTAAAQWKALRSYVAVGALFRIRDSLVIPNTGSSASHPYAIVGTGVTQKDRARIALSRPVQLSCRSSHKTDQHGPRPASESQEFQLTQRTGLVFSHADHRIGLDADGVFLLEQYVVLVQDVVGAEFLGWLPRQVIDSILLRRGLPPTRGHYPPQVSE